MFIGFHRGRGIVNMSIRLWTFGPYSHCELIFSNGDRHTSYPGSGTKWMPRLQMLNGVPEPRADWDIIRVDADDLRVRDWCNDHVDERYDWAGIIFSQIVPAKSHAGGKFWCSEAAVEALQFGYCAKIAKMDSRLSNPNNLFKALSSCSGT